MARPALFTDEELAWLAAGYRRWPLRVLGARFRARFRAHSGRALTDSQILNALKNRGRRSGRRPPRATAYRRWHPEHLAWLREHRPHFTLGELADAFRARFGIPVNGNQLSAACRRHGIPGRTTQFHHAQTPWNKGRRGQPSHPRSQATQFRPGHRPQTWVPVGTYSRRRGDYWYLKVRDNAKPSRHNWIAVHLLVWTDANGPVPAGHKIVFLDRDRDNCLDPDNLACIPNRITGRLNRMGWKDPNLTPNARRALIARAALGQAVVDAARRLGLKEINGYRIHYPEPAPEPAT